MKHLLVLAFAASLCAQTGGGGLAVHAIDVEGGKSTLFVSPSGESMLVDAGYAGFNGRDAGRIAAAAQAAGVKQIDYLVITHYHQDHAGGVPQLARHPHRGEGRRHHPDPGHPGEGGIRMVVTYGDFRLADLGDLYTRQSAALLSPTGGQAAQAGRQNTSDLQW